MTEISPDELEMEFAAALEGTAPAPEPQEAPEPEAAGDERDMAYDDGRLRNPETGQFETAEQREERLYANKYRSVEDLERGYQNAEQQIGQLGNEVGQWRQWAEHQQQLAQQQQTQQVFDEERLSQWDEFASERPVEAAQMALQQQNQILYERTMDTWYAEDPKSAARFERAIEAQWQQAQYQQAVAPLMAQQNQQAQLSAYMAVRQRHPDIDQWADGISRAAQVNPYLLPVLQHGTPAEKEQALETMYYMARGMGSPPPGQANGQQPPPAGPNGQQHRPVVASASSIPSGATGPRPGEDIHALFEEGLAHWGD